MAKRNVVTAVVILSAALVLCGGWAEAGQFSSAKTQIKAVIPAVQKLTVIEPAAVSIVYPWADSERKPALIFDDIGALLVESNTNWVLTASVPDTQGFKIFIKPADNLFTDWIPVSGSAVVYMGAQGSNLLSWDVKVKAEKALPCESCLATIQFVFSLRSI